MEKKVQQILEASNFIMLDYDKNRMTQFEESYAYLVDYAHKNQLLNTMISLKILPCFIYPKDSKVKHKEDGITDDKYMYHALYITQLLVDLHPNITKQEEDLLLSSALCHVIVEKVYLDKDGEELVIYYQLDPEVNRIIHIDIGNKRGITGDAYYKAVQEDKLALLVKLADRSYIVGNLYWHSIDQAQRYIFQTKNNFYSMCIYGKEHYPDVYLAINVLMEKMRCLADIADILSARFMQNTNMLNDEIIALKEDNARIRGIIKQLKG